MTDVAVYGATACGVMAAAAAHAAGARTALVDPGRHVGGMVSGGEVLHAVERAARDGGAVAVCSGFTPPEPMEWAR